MFANIQKFSSAMYCMLKEIVMDPLSLLEIWIGWTVEEKMCIYLIVGVFSFFSRNPRIVLLKWMEEGCKENMLTQQGKLETKETAGPTKFNPAIKEARIVDREAVETSWNDVWVGRVLLIGGAPSATWQHILLRIKTLQPKRSTFEHQPGSFPERECRCSQRSKGKRLGVGSLRKLYCKERKIQCWPSVLGELAQCEGGGAAEAVVAQRGCGTSRSTGQCPTRRPRTSPCLQHNLLDVLKTSSQFCQQQHSSYI